MSYFQLFLIACGALFVAVLCGIARATAQPDPYDAEQAEREKEELLSNADSELWARRHVGEAI